VQDKILHSPGRDASPRRPGVPAGRPYLKKDFVLHPLQPRCLRHFLLPGIKGEAISKAQLWVQDCPVSGVLVGTRTRLIAGFDLF
jgi:hypothetical protein